MVIEKNIMKEELIRPKNVFDEWLKLTEEDTKVFFKNIEKQEVACPACEADGKYAFNKQGFEYQCCPKCETLFVSPRPHYEAFRRYYTEAPSVEYWATTFYRQTADARRINLWRPKARLISQELVRYNATQHHIVDIGGGFVIFAEEMSLLTKKPVTVIEPGPKLAKNCRERGLSVVQKFLERVEEHDLPEGSKAYVSFELFEHLHSPAAFLTHLYSLMSSGDVFIFTTLSGTGFDIQILWEKSKSVSPPHHLNFFNPYSARLLLERLGFDQIDVVTPGQLDIDILCNSREKIQDRFIGTFIDYATAEQKAIWQKTIADTGWSSHMMVSCRKP